MRVYTAEMVLNSLREPAAILAPDGRIHAVNTQWLQVSASQALAGERFGSGEDYLGRCIEIRGALQVEELARGVRDVLDGRQPAFTLEYACDSATPLQHFELVVSALPTGDEMGALVVQHDITARKQIEAAKREAEKELKDIVDILPEGYWSWNMETGHFYYGERWCESLGYDRSEVEPTINGCASRVHPDDLPHVVEALNAYVEGRSQTYRCAFRLRMKNGTYRWNLDRGRIVAWDANGKPLRMVGLDIDISEQKEAERVVAEQSKRLMDLSTPLIPISDQVVVMPLIGTVDAQRADQVLSTLLHGLSRTQASVAILDITGMSLIDAHVAAVLVNAAKAVQLLGAQVVLTGVRPEVATILVGLDIAWENIVLRGTLQSGIAYATTAARARHAL
jgi:rsbT co-antagonist protein RsbR